MTNLIMTNERWRKWTAVILVMWLPQQCAWATDYTREQWQEIFKMEIEDRLSLFYALRAKSFADFLLAIEEEQEKYATRASLVIVEIQKLREALALDNRGNPATRLRDVRSALQIQSVLKERALHLQNVLTEFQEARSRICDRERINEMANEFHVSGLPEAKNWILSLQEQMAKIAGTSTESLQVKVTMTGDGSALNGVQVGRDENYQNPDQAKAIVIGTGVGTAIGSFAFFGVGTAIGAAVGAVVGTIASMFMEDPSVTRIRKLRQQSDFVIEAVEAVDRAGISDVAMKLCRTYAEEATFNGILAQSEQRIPQLANSVLESATQAEAISQNIDDDYRQELVRLRDYVYPKLEKVLDQKFEAYFSRSRVTSQKSKEFAQKQLPSALTILRSSSATEAQRFEAQEKLWSVILEGDARFSAAHTFSFQPESDSEARELFAWDGIVRAVYLNSDKLFSSKAGVQR